MKPPVRRTVFTPLIDIDVVIAFGIEKGWLPPNYVDNKPYQNISKEEGR